MTATLVRRERALGAVALLAITAGAFLFGYGVTLVAGRFDGLAPLAVVGLPLLPVWAAAVFFDPRVGVASVILLAPVGARQVPGLPVDLVQVAIVGVAVIVVLRQVVEGRPLLPVPAPLGWGVALLAWSLVALPSAIDGSLALRSVGALAGELLFAAVIVAACRTRHDVRVVVAVFVGTAFVAAVQAPGDTAGLGAAYGGAIVEGRANSFFTEPNQLGTYCMLALLAAIGLVLSARTRRARLAGYGVAGVIALGLLFSFSRGSWIGFSFGLLVLLFLLPEARRALAVIGIPLVVFAFVLGSFAPANPQVVVVGERLKSIVGERNPYDDRPSIWAEARREIVDDPITGEGPGNFPVASERATSESRSTFATHAHNLLLTWAAEAGLPAAILIVAFAVHVGAWVRRVGRRARHLGRPRDAQLIGGLAAAGAAVLGQGIVDYTMRNSVIHTAVFTVVGCLLAALVVEEAPA